MLAFDRKIYFQFLKRLVSILKLLQLLIFSFVKKDALLGILVSATVEAHVWLTSRRGVFSTGARAGLNLSAPRGMAVQPAGPWGRPAAPTVLGCSAPPWVSADGPVPGPRWIRCLVSLCRMFQSPPADVL